MVRLIDRTYCLINLCLMGICRIEFDHVCTPHSIANYSATTVMLFWFKMQTSLENSVILLFFDQIMLGFWLLAFVLLPGTW